MATITLDVPALFPQQRQIADCNTRFVAAACGRRFGKTEAGKRRILRAALAGQTAWWLSPTYQMATGVWRDLKSMLRPIRPHVREVDRTLELINGGSIAVRSTAAHDNLRGAGLDFAVLDEAAFMHPDVWPQIVRPMLLERSGGALFLSTPNGRNWFFDVYQRGVSGDDPEWRAFHFTSFDSPLVPAGEYDRLRAMTPERVFAEEYLAEFMDTSGSVFRFIREAAVAEPGQQPLASHVYVMGVDWGRENDFTAIAVFDVTTSSLVALDRFNQVGWSLQRGRLAALAATWKPTVILAEANSIGAPNIEALQAEGLPVEAFTTTMQTKRAVIEALALALEQQRIRILNDETLLSEMMSFEQQRLPGGAIRYGARSGAHDDTVMALALAWHAAGRQPAWRAFLV